MASATQDRKLSESIFLILLLYVSLFCLRDSLQRTALLFLITEHWRFAAYRPNTTETKEAEALMTDVGEVDKKDFCSNVGGALQVFTWEYIRL